jgi:hypothetical protein
MLFGLPICNRSALCAIVMGVSLRSRAAKRIALVFAAHQLMDGARIFNARQARHEGILPHRPPPRNGIKGTKGCLGAFHIRKSLIFNHFMVVEIKCGYPR